MDDFMQPFSWRSPLARALDFLNKLFLLGVKAGDTEVHLVILKRKFCVKIEIPAILLLGLCGKLGIIQFLTTIFGTSTLNGTLGPGSQVPN